MLSKENQAIVAMAEAKARNVETREIVTRLPDGWSWRIIDDEAVPVCPSGHTVDRNDDVVFCPICKASGIVVRKEYPIANDSVSSRVFRWIRNRLVGD